MAVETFARRFAEFYFRLVAALAAERPVGALEFEIREFVIEGFVVELDDIGIAPFMLGMTMLAFRIHGVGAHAMQAALPLAVRGHVLMTRQAEPHLRLLIERLVAVGAVFFLLLVPLDELPRHHQPVEQALRSGGPEGRRNKQQSCKNAKKRPYAQSESPQVAEL
jgi:hypothetical protein